MTVSISYCRCAIVEVCATIVQKNAWDAETTEAYMTTNNATVGDL